MSSQYGLYLSEETYEGLAGYTLTYTHKTKDFSW